MNITEITPQDFEKFWPTLKTTLALRETYSFEPELSYEAAFELWCKTPQKTFVVKEDNEVTGSYFIKPNASGPGSHVCNCGYIVVPQFRGRGIAERLCLHSQEVAVELGYLAMQFNSVVSTNKGALHLWKKLGFNVIGRIPKGFRHRELGYVDSIIMYKQLKDF